MPNYLGRKMVLAAFGGAMALCGPSAPVLAAPASCYEVILYCKYHQSGYASFQECIDENDAFFCPPEGTNPPPGGQNAIKND